MLYAAYGSNLHAEDLAEWAQGEGVPTPLGEPVARGWIVDRHLAFTAESPRRGGGVLDVPPATGAVAPCVLFEVDEEAMAILDRKEAAGSLYRRTPVVVAVFGATPTLVRATTYEVLPERRGRIDAAPAYLETVRQAYARHDLDEWPLERAAEHAAAEAFAAPYFVYGTLMRGESRFEAMRRHGVALVCMATVRGALFDLGDYPGLKIVDEAAGTPARPIPMVEGELVRLERTIEATPALDAIEGFVGLDGPSLFVRMLVPVHLRRGGAVAAWAYLYAPEVDVDAALPHGSWRAARGRHESFLRRLGGAYAPHLRALRAEPPRQGMQVPAPEEAGALLAAGLVDEEGLVALTGFARAGVDALPEV